MPAASAEEWLRKSVLPQPHTYENMLAFFGIPPYSADRLDENISRKRRSWQTKTSCGNDEGRQLAKKVVELVHKVSVALKRGAVVELDGGAALDGIPEEIFQTLAELWRLIAGYVFADDYDRALRVAREAVARWGTDSDGASVLAWVVATGFESGALLHPAVLQDGLAAAAVATRRSPGEPRNWESQASLLLRANRVQDALRCTDNAARALPVLTARLELLRATGMISLNRVDDAVVAVVRAVVHADRDPVAASAIRSQATRLLVDWLAPNLLPIQSTAGLARYVELVQTAAWCSHGVPEAEDLVRVHRLWAANAGQRVFDGSWKLRSFLAVCTGFVSLPLHNLMRSAPAWQVFLRGIRGAGSEPFWVVARPKYIQVAHRVRIVTHIDQI